jgi:hypothetical protein
MPRFVVRHRHSPESCPANDPAMGAMLLNHLSPPNSARYGVVIQGEAVVRGAHTLFFIAEAADESGLRLFLAPLRESVRSRSWRRRLTLKWWRAVARPFGGADST